MGIPGFSMSEPTADRDPFEVVAESFLARFRSGERPSIEEYATGHPELADQIRELLPALVMVEQDLTIDRDPGSDGPQPHNLAPFIASSPRCAGEIRASGRHASVIGKHLYATGRFGRAEVPCPLVPGARQFRVRCHAKRADSLQNQRIVCGPHCERSRGISRLRGTPEGDGRCR